MVYRIKASIAVLCVAALAAVSMAPAHFDKAYGASLPSLSDKSIYYLGDKVGGGQCMIASNFFLLRRAAVLEGSSKWNTVTFRNVKSKGIKSKEYRYTNDGYTYHVNKYRKFSNTTQAGVKRQLIQLLKDRPEGVIIYGKKSQDKDAAAGKAAEHGILITAYKNGTFYGIDPSHNRNGKKKGIEKLANTSIVTLKGVTHYMCIQDVSYKKPSTTKTTAKTTTKATTKTTAKTTTKSTVKTTTKSSAKTTTKTTVKTTAKATESAASTLKIKNYSYPKTISQGGMFDVKGIITSNYKIVNVTVSVINSKGKSSISKSVSPNAKKYDLVKVDNDIKFGKLEAGSYTYRITAKDGKKSLTLVNKEFKVESSPEPSSSSNMKITGATYPKELKKGQMFTMKGKITSNYNLKTVTAGVYKTSGEKVTTASKSLKDKKSYDVYGLDEEIKFGKLAKGTYYYKVTATDTKKTVTLLNKKFVVK